MIPTKTYQFLSTLCPPYLRRIQKNPSSRTSYPPSPNVTSWMTIHHWHCQGTSTTCLYPLHRHHVLRSCLQPINFRCIFHLQDLPSRIPCPHSHQFLQIIAPECPPLWRWRGS